MSTMKLTKPQIAVLREVADRPQHFAASYPPVKKLLAAGMVAERQGRWSSDYEITDLGRSALSETIGEGK